LKVIKTIIISTHATLCKGAYSIAKMQQAPLHNASSRICRSIALGPGETM